MNDWKNYLVQAVLAEYPHAHPIDDFYFVSTDAGPVLEHWNEAALGPFVEAEWKAKCEALGAVETRAAINAQRDRRNLLPFAFGGHLFQADPASQRRIEKARMSALAANLSGAQPGDYRWHGEPVDFVWISEDNTHVPMDAQTVVAFGNALAAREGLLVLAASALKAMDPIPADFETNDAYWQPAPAADPAP